MVESRRKWGCRRHALMLVLALQLTIFTSLGDSQTIAPCPPRQMFSCPVPRCDSSPRRIKSALTNTLVTAVELERKAGNENAERYHWMNGRDALTVPVRTEQGGAYGWIQRQVLEPEVVHFKNVSMTGPLVAAIKRKNPLCLLLPTSGWACAFSIFDMDW